MQLKLEILGTASELSRVLAFLETPETVDQIELPLSTAPTPVSTPEVVASEPADDGVDSEGMPWDDRIHAGSKTKTSAGVWTKKRGVDKETREAVEKELKQQNAPVLPMPTDMPATGVAPAMPTPAATPQPMPMPAGDGAPAMPTPAPAPAPADYEPVKDFAALMGKVIGAQAAGEITPDYLTEVTARFNEANGTQFKAFTDLSAAVEHIPAMDALIHSEGKY